MITAEQEQTITVQGYPVSHPYLKNHLMFCGIKDEHQTKVIERTGQFYEQDLLDALEPYTWRKAGIVIDVGSCLGNHTLYFAGVLGFHVLAIEPCGLSRGLSMRTIAENDLGDYVLFSHIAAGYSTGEAFLDYPSVAKIGSNALHMIQTNGATPVNVDTLDNQYQSSRWRKRPVVAIKIDVEGYETKVLKGAREIINEHRPVMAIECATDAALHEVDAILQDRGYQYKGPYCATPTYIFYAEEPRTG